MSLEEEIADRYGDWCTNPQRRYLETREERLLLDLIGPREGETFLEVGCGTGEHLLLLHRQGCRVTGTDSSSSLLEIAASQLENKAELRPGHPADLPFSDNEFDIVSLILPPTFSDNAEKSIGEAIRVCRGRVFIGIMNKYSLAGARLKIHLLERPSTARPTGFSHIGEMMGIVRRLLPGVNIQWGSVIFLPAHWYGFAARLEEAMPMLRNPFGAFLGLSFPVAYSVRTVQDIIGDPFKFKAEREQPARGILRGR